LPRPKKENPQKLFELIDNKDAALLDTRNWEEYRQAHVPGALFVLLNTAFNTAAGCYITPDTPIYLIIEEDELSEAIIDLIRIGLDKIEGYVTYESLDKYIKSGGKTTSIEEIDVKTSSKRLADNSAFLLDVRREAELKEVGYVKGAHNIAHTCLCKILGNTFRESDHGLLQVGKSLQIRLGLSQKTGI
jgi:hydroxyacylglutathione hydrolase